MEEGEILAVLYASDPKKLTDAVKYLETVYQYSDDPVTPMKEIIAYVTKDGIKRMDER